MGMLLKEEGGEEGAGGGSPDDKSGKFTEAQLEQIAEVASKVSNSAFTAQMKRLNLSQKIQDAIGGLDIDSKFEQLAKTLKPDGDEPENPKPGDDKAIPPEVAKQLKALADRVEASEAEANASKKALAEAQEKHRFESGRQALYESLKGHADERLHDVWVEHLIHNNRLEVDDEGVVKLQVEHSPVRGMPKQKDFLPLEDAIQHLVTSDDAKRFMAAPDPKGGAGNPGPRAGRAAAGGGIDSKNPADRVRARLEQMGINADEQFGA